MMFGMRMLDKVNYSDTNGGERNLAGRKGHKEGKM
jgi:hypothetical protein